MTPGTRVRLTCEGKTASKGATGTVIPSRGPGGFVDVCLADGQIRGYGRGWVEAVPAETLPVPSWGSHDEAFVRQCVESYERAFKR